MAPTLNLAGWFYRLLHMKADVSSIPVKYWIVRKLWKSCAAELLDWENVKLHLLFFYINGNLYFQAHGGDKGVTSMKIYNSVARSGKSPENVNIRQDLRKHSTNWSEFPLAIAVRCMRHKIFQDFNPKEVHLGNVNANIAATKHWCHVIWNRFSFSPQSHP